MSHFHTIDRDTDFLLPPSVQEWLPEGHLARYVVEVVEGLDLSPGPGGPCLVRRSMWSRSWKDWT
jgi:hypothetical protein